MGAGAAIRDLDELNNYLSECCLEDRQRQIEGRNQTVAEAFRDEQRQLRSTPAEEFDLAETAACIVDANSCVRVKCNRYSTPLRPGTRAEVKVDASHVNVFCEGKPVARHERSYVLKQEVLVLEHYLGVLEHKPGAFAQSKALAQYRQAGLWPPASMSFGRSPWSAVAAAKAREMIGLLQLIAVHGHKQVRSAIDQALAFGSSDAATVRHLLRPDGHNEHSVAPLSGTGLGFERPLPKLDMYDQLLNTRPQPEVRA